MSRQAPFFRQRFEAALAEYPDPLSRPKKADVARAMGVDPTTVSKWVSGDRAIGVAEVAAMAALLRVSPCWLAFGIGTMREP